MPDIHPELDYTWDAQSNVRQDEELAERGGGGGSITPGVAVSEPEEWYVTEILVTDPTSQPDLTADGTDPATTMALANSLKASHNGLVADHWNHYAELQMLSGDVLSLHALVVALLESLRDANIIET